MNEIREPTAAEHAGMTWWNALPEQLRASWLKLAEASAPSAAGAWQAFKAARRACEHWADKGPVRVFNGLEFSGFEFSVRMHPGVHPAHPSLPARPAGHHRASPGLDDQSWIL